MAQPWLAAAALWAALAGCVGSLPVAPDHRLADLVLAALDGEALYTVAGGVKPVSSGFWQGAITVAAPADDAADVDAVRRALASLDDPAMWWGAVAFDTAHDGERAVHACVVDRAALRELLARRADVFAPFGLTPWSSPGEVLATVERLPRSDRFRGYGLLFGYPERAVEFFVAADAEREQHESGVAPREFRSIATFAAATGRFVWAVPKGDVPTADEERTRARCEAILARYRELRADWVASGRPRPAEFVARVRRLGGLRSAPGGASAPRTAAAAVGGQSITRM